MAIKIVARIVNGCAVLRVELLLTSKIVPSLTIYRKTATTVSGHGFGRMRPADPCGLKLVSNHTIKQVALCEFSLSGTLFRFMLWQFPYHWFGMRSPFIGLHLTHNAILWASNGKKQGTMA